MEELKKVVQEIDIEVANYNDLILSDEELSTRQLNHMRGIADMLHLLFNIETDLIFNGDKIIGLTIKMASGKIIVNKEY